MLNDTNEESCDCHCGAKKYKMVINGLRDWVGLTDEEKHKLMWMFHQPGEIFKHYKYMEAVEAKLKAKNYDF